MNKKVIFLSNIDYYGSSAAAARINMYLNILELERVEFDLHSTYGFLEKTFPKKILKNRYLKFILYPIKNILFTINLKRIIENNENIVFYLYPNGQVLLDCLLILYLKFLRKQSIFLEVNEIRRFGNNIKVFSLKYISFYIYEYLSKYFDGLVCISKNINLYYLKYNTNCLLIPILSNTQVDYQCNCNYIKNNIFNIGFTGSIDVKKENLNVFFEALSILHKKNIFFVLNLYGSIKDMEELQILINSHGLHDYIKYHGVINQELVQSVLAKQDLLVLPRNNTDQNKYGFSTKLSEYMVSGVPILITDVSDNLYYLTPSEDCILAVADCSKDFAKKIEELILSYKILAPSLAKNAFLTARKNFDYTNHSKSFVSFLDIVSSK